MTINNLQSALELWDNGFNIIPIKSDPITPTPKNPAEDFRNYKTPFGKWQQYQNKRETREVVKKWYEDRPYLNLGIITNGLLVVDADTDEGVQWCKDNLSVGIYSITAKGAHFFFKQPKNQKVNCEIKNTKCGIDIKADGGLVVAPPSVHGSGKFYRWSSDETPMFNDIPEMSLADYEVLQEFLNPTQKYTTPHRKLYQNSVKNHKSALPQDFYPPAEEGGRNDALASQTGSLLGKGFSLKQIHQHTIDWNRKNPSPLSD